MTDLDWILTEREMSALVARDSMPHLVTRVRNLLAHDRRITLVSRYTHESDNTPEVITGLTLDTGARGGGIFESVRDGDYHHLDVSLRPGIVGFGFGAYTTTTEAEVRRRYRHSSRRDMTLVEIVGGRPGESPSRSDRIVIQHWNQYGVCLEKIVAFDLGSR